MPKSFSEKLSIPDTINPNDTWAQISYILRQQAAKSPAAAVAIMDGLEALRLKADEIIGKPDVVKVLVSYPGYAATTVSPNGRTDISIPCNEATEVSPQVLQLLKAKEAELAQVAFAGSTLKVSVLA